MHTGTMQDPSSPFVVTCEHASNAVPDSVSLGVPEPLLHTHSAWDPGARQVAEALGRRLLAPVELGRYSRLLVDLNRSSDNGHEVIPAVCYGVEVPANRDISESDRERRLRLFHAPYRAAVQAHIERALAACGRCVMISVHSFTPELDPLNRRFDVGIMFDRSIPAETKVVQALERALKQRGLTFARNRPYDGQDDSVLTGYRRRWQPPEFLGIEIEINQGLIDGESWFQAPADAIAAGVIDARS